MASISGPAQQMGEEEPEGGEGAGAGGTGDGPAASSEVRTMLALCALGAPRVQPAASIDPAAGLLGSPRARRVSDLPEAAEQTGAVILKV